MPKRQPGRSVLTKKRKVKNPDRGVRFAYAFWTFLKKGGCVFRMQFGHILIKIYTLSNTEEHFYINEIIYIKRPSIKKPTKIAER